MYIFNPEHDLCIANGSPHFVPPNSAMEFGRDCSGIAKWMEGLAVEGESILPWGWNHVLRKRLLREGYDEKVLASVKEIDAIRKLSERSLAVEALKAVEPSCDVPLIAESIPDIVGRLKKIDRGVLKSPVSGSGKGLRWVDMRLSDSDEGWCRNVINKYGYVILEPRYNVIGNYAMLFRCGDRMDFAGYSMFDTINGSYHSNILASDEFIERSIASYVGYDRLLRYRDSISDFLARHFIGRYRGYIGVDQFVYVRDGEFFFNPVVEINVRMTMGLLARNIYDRYLDTIFPADGSFRAVEGRYIMSVEYRKNVGVLESEYCIGKGGPDAEFYGGICCDVGIKGAESSVPNVDCGLKSARHCCYSLMEIGHETKYAVVISCKII